MEVPKPNHRKQDVEQMTLRNCFKDGETNLLVHF